jgi:biopolymer transport protein ExbB
MLWLAAGHVQAAEVDLAAQIKEGGLPLLAIIALSILSTAVAIERLRNLRAKRVVPDGLVEQVEGLWERRDYDGIQTVVAEDDSSLARVIAYLVHNRHQDYAVVSAGAGDIASVELRRHQQKFYALSITATVAPILGLLGTVLGMIESFNTIAYQDGMGNPALLAGGISMALVNTAAGLCVALPALLMHHFFKNRIAHLGLTLETGVNRVMHRWFLPAQDGVATLQAVGHAR